jgi:hypothetical protein
MTRQTRKALLASLGFGLVAVTAATLASANTSPYPADDYDVSIPADEQASLMPAPPASGTPLLENTTAAACLTTDRMVASFEADKAMYGGELVLLADGLEQSFADTWRREVDAESVTVSTVIAHTLTSADGDQLVDVVEFDKSGCALSRTILSGGDWSMLLETAAGRET